MRFLVLSTLKSLLQEVKYVHRFQTCYSPYGQYSAMNIAYQKKNQFYLESGKWNVNFRPVCSIKRSWKIECGDSIPSNNSISYPYHLLVSIVWIFYLEAGIKALTCFQGQGPKMLTFTKTTNRQSCPTRRNMTMTTIR